MREWITFPEMVERPDIFPTVREDFQIALAEKNWRINPDWYIARGHLVKLGSVRGE